jgi:hypothetical protein
LQPVPCPPIAFDFDCRFPPNFIVFSCLADEFLWAEVLNLGGFDVLMTPFEPEEVLRVAFSGPQENVRIFGLTER